MMDNQRENLPDPLMMSSGQQVQTVEQWTQTQRPFWLELFRQYVYGREPIGRPDSLAFVHVSAEPVFQDAAVRKRVDVTFSGPGGDGRIRVLLYIPNRQTKVPVLMFAAINSQQIIDAEPADYADFWPVEDIVSRGYAAVGYEVEDLDPDYFDEGYRNGVHGLFDPPGDQPRPADAWGAISAWAWGASRVMDYLETDGLLDATRIGLVGFSRGGKTALWAGAIDERFALVVSNTSGCTGAAISRGKGGERLVNINDGNPHWFNDTYKTFNGREEALPIDQHILLSLIAPRLLYVASASEDDWADPQSEFLGLYMAQPVYELYGNEERGIEQMPPVNTPIYSERLGYHVRKGKHAITCYDWHRYMDFADGRL